MDFKLRYYLSTQSMVLNIPTNYHSVWSALQLALTYALKYYSSHGDSYFQTIESYLLYFLLRYHLPPPG